MCKGLQEVHSLRLRCMHHWVSDCSTLHTIRRHGYAENMSAEQKRHARSREALPLLSPLSKFQGLNMSELRWCNEFTQRQFLNVNELGVNSLGSPICPHCKKPWSSAYSAYGDFYIDIQAVHEGTYIMELKLI